MRRRGSIARLMLAVGLSALALTLLRAWLGPSNRFGFLGLMAIGILVALVAGLVTTGPMRRFFAGASTTGSILWVAVLIDPSILESCLEHLIIPFARWIEPGPCPGLTRFEFIWIWPGLDDIVFPDQDAGPAAWIRRRASICCGLRAVQAYLLILPALLAALGGLIAATYRPRPTVPSSPADRP